MRCQTPAFWYALTPTWQARLLQPVAWLYGVGAWVHGTWRVRHVYRPTVPVISIGNLTVGGSGKTPVTQCLLNYFHKKVRVAVVGCGSSQNPVLVTPAHAATQVGDEPLMLARQYPDVRVWACTDKARAVRAAEADGAELILLDDGFQRRDIITAVNVLVVGPRGIGNGLLVPAGPLREPLAAMARADIVVTFNPKLTPSVEQPTFAVMQALCVADIARCRGKPLVAFAGIAHPEAFFNALRTAGLKVTATVPFPDHHRYTAADKTRLQRLAKEHGAMLVCTAKDGVKLPEGWPYMAVRSEVKGAIKELLKEINQYFKSPRI